jgi:Rad3-related DNA helicase
MVNQLHQFVEEGHNLPQALRNVGEFLSKETLQTFLRRNENDTERLVLRLQEELNNFIRNLSIDNGERLDVDAIFGN